MLQRTALFIQDFEIDPVFDIDVTKKSSVLVYFIWMKKKNQILQDCHQNQPQLYPSLWIRLIHCLLRAVFDGCMCFAHNRTKLYMERKEVVNELVANLPSQLQKLDLSRNDLLGGQRVISEVSITQSPGAEHIRDKVVICSRREYSQQSAEILCKQELNSRYTLCLKPTNRNIK